MNTATGRKVIVAARISGTRVVVLPSDILTKLFSVSIRIAQVFRISIPFFVESVIVKRMKKFLSGESGVKR
jgi:hypothetical protein